MYILTNPISFIPLYLTEETSVLIHKDGPCVNKHRFSAAQPGQGRHSQCFLDTVSNHQCCFGIVCQRSLKQKNNSCRDDNIKITYPERETLATCRYTEG